jgi:hypothetical protein
VGAHISDLFLQLFGLASVALPILLILTAIRMFFSDRAPMPFRKATGALLLLIALSGFLALFPKIPLTLLTRHDNGGLVGGIVEGQLVGMLNTLGAAIVLGAATVLTLMVTMEVSLSSTLKWLGSKLPSIPVTRKAVPPVLARLSSKWMDWVQQRRLLADERHAEKMERRTQEAAEKEQRRLDEQERRERAREMLTAEHRRRSEEEHRRTEAEALNPLPVMGGSAADPESRVASEPIAEPAISPIAVTSSARGEGAAAVRAYRAKIEQGRSAQSPEVTMDPDVAEMISTASIVRTAPLEKTEAEPAGSKPVPGRRKGQADAAYGSRYELPSLDLLETPIGSRTGRGGVARTRDHPR